MATNEIRLKLVIDGKEAQGVLLNTDELLGKLRNKTKGTGKEGAADMGAMTQAVGQLGWALGDANMFFVNFRSGMMSVGNNIPMIAQGFMRAGEAAKTAGISMKTYFAQSLTGAGGVMLGINAAMFAMQSLPMIFAAINKESKQAAADGLEDFTKQLEKITIFTMADKLAEVRGELILYRSIVAQQNATGGMGLAFVKLIGYQSTADEMLTVAEQKVRMAERKDKELTEQGMTRIGLLKAEIDNYDILMDKVKSGANADKEIHDLAVKKAAKQKELSDLTTVEKQVKEKNLIISDAELAKDIQKLKAQLEKTTSIREELELRKKLNDLNQQAMKLGTSYDSKAINKMAQSIDFGISGASSLNGTTPIEKPAVAIKETNDELMVSLLGMHALEKGWQSAGQSIAQSLSGPLRVLQQSNNALESMIGNILEVGLQMATTGLFGGLFSMLGGGGFLGGFMGALGITKMAKGGLITEPIMGLGLNTGGRYLMGENGNELVTPRASSYGSGALEIRVSGELTGNGTSLRAMLKRLDKMESRYK
jgi:hypothetical protein